MLSKDDEPPQMKGGLFPLRAASTGDQMSLERRVHRPSGSKDSKLFPEKMTIDAQTLKKKISRTCDETARTLLNSLLLYVLDRADGPQKSENKATRANCPSQLQEVGRRPTRFQLLQAKFMGTGREPHLKKTREVGRLISKDKQGPGRSFVNATINKLLEKTKEGVNSASQRTPSSEKPQWSPPSGKSTVKNILKKFLAAEEKEAKEKEARQKPPAQRSATARGLLPRIVGRSSILSKLRERFEQSGCLHSEAGVLPLHREGRKSLQKKNVHRPQVRVLHIATMATSCTRIPPARFLACTAEPLPALSIATIVCGPQSWLSHCAKLSHSESRLWPTGETVTSSNSENPGPGGNKSAGFMSEEHKERLKSSEVPVDSHVTLNMPTKDQASSGHVPEMSPLGLDSPRDTGLVGRNRIAEPNIQEMTADTQGLEDNTREAPEMTMAVCSSDDEAEKTPLGPEREPFFAIQRHLPEQEAEVPLSAPLAIQAERRTQPAIKPPQITVQLPIVHEMPVSPGPLQYATCHNSSHLLRKEDVVENKQAAFSTVSEDRRGYQAPEILRKAREMPVNPQPVAEGLQEDIQDDTHSGGDASQMFLIPTPSRTFHAGPEKKHSPENSHDLRSRSGTSEERISDISWEKHLCPESKEASPPSDGTSSYPTVGRSYAGVGTSSSSYLQQGVPPTVLVSPQGCVRPGSSIAPGENIPFGQEDCKGPLNQSSLPSSMAQENISHGLGDNSQSTLDKQPITSPKVSGEVVTMGTVTGLTIPQPSSTQNPEYKTLAWPANTQDIEDKIMPHTSDSKDAEHKKLPQTSGAQDVKHKQMSRASDTQHNAHQLVRQPHVSQDVELKTTSHGHTSQEAKHKIALRPHDTQNVEHKTAAPQQACTHDTKQVTLWPGGTQDNEQKIAPWPHGGQDPEHKAVSQTSNSQDAEHKTTVWIGDAQNPRQKATLQSAGTQNTKYKIMPQAGGAQDTEHKMTVRVNDGQDGEQRPESKTAPWSGSLQDYKDKITQELSSHPLVPSRATEGSISEDMVQSHLLKSATPAVQQEEAADSHLAPIKSPACVSNEPALRQSSSAIENKMTAKQSKAFSRPQKNPAEYLGQSQLPSVDQQALDRKDPERERHFSGAAHSSTYPLRLATKGETRQVEPAYGPEPPVQMSEHRSVLQTKSLGSEAKESLPTQRDMGRPQSHLGAEETGTGHVRLDQTGQSDMQNVAEPQAWAFQDLVVDEKMPVGEGPCQRKDRGQEHPLRPLGRQVRNPTQGDSLQDDGNLATPGNLRKPYGRALQKQSQSQRQASHPVPQAWEQPDSPPEEVPTAGTRGEPPSLGPKLSSQRSQSALPLLQEGQSLASCRTTVCSLDTADDSPSLTSKTGGHPLIQTLAQDGPPNTPKAEKDLSDHRPRKSVHFAKYYAQSFRDQKAFDLSFRPTVLRAGDTFEPPK
ncbi:[ ADP-ribosylarginine] hydrolase 1 [Sigmodon hispidus]